MGSGDSLRSTDVAALREAGCYCIACNDNWVYCPDLLYVPDLSWLKVNEDAARCESIPERWTPSEEGARLYGWNYIEVAGSVGNPDGLSDRRDFIHHGGFAGFQMLNIAAVMGFRKIVLLGYDCAMTNGKLRWRGTHPPGVEKSTRGEKFEKWRKRLDAVAPELERRGIGVRNASRSTALSCFPIITLEEAVDYVLETTSD